MFANCQLGGMNFGFPDVCKTPVGPVPAPIPYPNISTGLTANPVSTALTVLLECMPAHTMETDIPFSQGDDAGVELGLVSELVMGPTQFLLGSFICFYDGMPATKLTSVTGHNGICCNCPGVTLAPAQFTVLILG